MLLNRAWQGGGVRFQKGKILAIRRNVVTPDLQNSPTLSGHAQPRPSALYICLLSTTVSSVQPRPEFNRILHVVCLIPGSEH